jgi:hypothetical protein
MLNRSSTKVALAAGLAALSGLSFPAMADCDANGNAVAGTTANCWHLKGSDTWFDVMTTSIKNARLAGITGSNELFYDGSGSGNAESQMDKATTTDLGAQSIGPMSRNFRPKFIDTLTPPTTTPVFTGNFAQRTGTAAPFGTQVGHAAWAPTCANVLGLDAAVFVTRATGAGSGLNDIDVNTSVNSAATPASFKQSVINCSAAPGGNCSTNFADGTAFNNINSTINYSNLWSIVLSGVDGSGSIRACADPRRVKALLDLSTAVGVSTLDHIYRRDDNSGTTDTIKDRIMVVTSPTNTATPTVDPRYPLTGGRFCNGQSIGQINSSTNQTGLCAVTRDVCLFGFPPPTGFACPAHVDPNTGVQQVCQVNLNNQDVDPIRRPCTAADSTHAPTSCTDLTTGKPCQAGDGNANCTQGLVVALTDTDPGSSDITTSIANRIKNGGGSVIGFAGNEAVNGLLFQTKSVSINGTKANDTNVRNSAYLLARRLFLQNAAAAGDLAADLVDDLAVNIAGGGDGGATQFNDEQNLWAYMSQRGNTDPVMDQFNFVHCSSLGDGNDPCSELNNLCALPAAASAPPFAAAFPNGSVATTTGVPVYGSVGSGGAKSVDSQGNTWNGTTAVATTCAVPAAGAQNSCITDGSTCTGGACPAANNRPSNAACTRNSDCASGVCTDVLGLGTPGALYSLVCQ